MPRFTRLATSPPVGLDPMVCEREPIHIPGAIQPHGALLAVLADSRIITHASANLFEILEQAPDAVLGQPLDHIFGDAAEYILKSTTPGAETLIKQQTALNGQLLRFHGFRSGRHVAIDIQPVHLDPGTKSPMIAVQAILETFERAKNRAELYQAAIAGLQTISGYDRVMVYQFGDRGHGEVVAEVHAAHLEPYLRNHYPTTDIPSQARQQFLRKRVASVADSSYQPVPLLVEARFDDGEPLDLTRSNLRSVSPIHCEFMRNMGTSASLSIGLVSGSDLFGVIICHHSMPRIAGPDLQMAADMIGRVVSLLVISLGEAEIYAERNARSATLRAVICMLAAPLPLTDALVAAELELLRLLDATGAVIRLDGSLLCLGTTPPPTVTAQLLAIMESKAARTVIAMDNVALAYPELVDCKVDGSGALLSPLSQGGEDLILWFRPELSRVVTWGGNPNEHTQDSITGQILPRASFAAWKETTNGRSKPWTGAHLALSAALRRAFEEEVAKRARVKLALLRQYEKLNDSLEIKISQRTKALEKEISERLKAEASEMAMRESETRFRRVVEASPNAMVVISSNGMIGMVNTQAEKVFGYRRDEMLGKAVEMLVPERFRSHHPALRGAFFNDPQRRVVTGRDLFGLRKDGTEFPLEIGLSPIETDDGTMVLSAIVDISERYAGELERKQQRRELERSNADLEEFAYIASHDLKEPLRGIANNARFLLEDYTDKLDQAGIARLLRLGYLSQRMEQLINDLLYFSRLGHPEPEIQLTDLNTVIRDIEIMSETTLNERNATIVIPRQLPLVSCNKTRITEVFRNLITNAVKYNDNTVRRIEIGYCEEVQRGDSVERQVFYVKDNGIGIAEEFHEEIFRIFKRLNAEDDDKKGTGVGLTFVRRIVERDGGRIWLDSAPGEGSTFYFTMESRGGS